LLKIYIRGIQEQFGNHIVSGGFEGERITMPKRGVNWAFLKFQQKLNPKYEPNFTQITNNK
jgi:hypothetical protein